LTTGILGGAFDPPHRGHVELARRAKQELGLAKLLVLVADDPGHKHVATPVDLRLQLARAAFPGDEVLVDDHARTVDTLRAHPEWEGSVFLVGADQFADFLTWKEPNEVLRLARLGVATRPGFSRDALQAVLAQLAEPTRVLFFEIEPTPVASRDLRARLRRGEDVAAEVPSAVLETIRSGGLYAAGGGYNPSA